MSDPVSDLDEIRARMSARRTELRVVEPVSDDPDHDESTTEEPADDDPAAAALTAAEEALAEAQAWATARKEAFVATESTAQLSLVEFLR
jgi:hypothetical protein